MYYQWAPYVPVAERRRKAAAEMAQLAKKGQTISPVRIEGRAIATTVWGKAWCANLEAYSDYANRLPRGRTYVRNGSVADLQIAPGRIEARVSGSSIYRTTVTVTALPKPRWETLVTDCAGGIDSLVELLQGRFSTGVMERLCRQGDGLFPTPKEIKLDCSCPDGAYMCKHVAAVLYGVGARLDHQPELLFTLRQVAATDLLAKAGAGLATNATAPSSDRTLAADDVGALFGLEMDQPESVTAKPSAPVVRAKAKPARTTRDPASRLLCLLRKRGSLDNAAAREATGLDAAAVRPLLQRLVAEGHARIVGQKRGTRYVAT
jgi:uncharacterized Zn finger protein